MSLALVQKSANETEFLVLFNRLCVALRETQDESGITQQVYYEALRDMPEKALDAGAAALMKEPGRRFFPTTAEWRSAAMKAQEQDLRAAVQPIRGEPWRHECRDCEDSGWVIGLMCSGNEQCGRRQKHDAHTYTVPCACRPTNRTYLRHQAFGGGAA